MHTNAHRPSAPPPMPSCRPPCSLLLRTAFQVLLDIGRRGYVPKSLHKCLQSSTPSLGCLLLPEVVGPSSGNIIVVLGLFGFGSVFPSSLIKFACPLVLALYCGPQRHVHASPCIARRLAFVVMPRTAWVRRQRAGANPGGPPLLDLWLLCWSMAGGVSRGT